MKQILCLLFIISFSCNDKREIKHQKTSVLEYFDIDTSWHYINKTLGACFEDSIDAYLEIRFSTAGTFLQPNKYLYLKYNGTSWRGVAGLHPRIVGEKSEKLEITPKIGWQNFQDSLLFIDINALGFRDNEKDSLGKFILDGESLHLEIITPNQYKVYNFHEPEYLIKESTKSETVTRFKRLFNLVNYNFNGYYIKSDANN